jgi:minor curlin subunit
MKIPFQVMPFILGLILPTFFSSARAQGAAAMEQRLAQEITNTAASVMPAASQDQAIIMQHGAANEATATQRYGAGGPSNLVMIEQAGAANITQVSQQGNGLRTTVQQRGTGNVAESELRGENLESLIQQNGEDNLVQQQVQGNDQRYVIQQDGVGNELRQVETSSTNRGYEVHQRGNGIRMTIVQGQAVP